MAGYITQRISLTVYLNQHGYNLNESYSISTSYIALFSICSFVWGLISQYLPTHEKIATLAILAVSTGLLLLTFPYKNIEMAGISFIIIGGSLYFTFMSLVVNNHFNGATERQQGNHLYQIMFNMGALIGVLAIGLLPVSRYHDVYRFGSIITVFGFYLLLKNNISIHNINSIPSSLNQKMMLIFALLSTFIFVYTLLKFGNITRFISIFGFIIGGGYILYLAFKENNKNYLTFIAMLILCGFPYWLAVSIVYSQFTIFLTQQVNSTLFGITIPPMAVLSLDAVANVIFGFGIYSIYKRRQIAPRTLLLYSLFLTALAFSFLVTPLYLTNSTQKISLIWPMFSISAYAVAEFLLISTLTAQISTLVHDKNRQGIFISMEYLGSAVCASIAYYFMRITTVNVGNEFILAQDLSLYSIMMTFTLIVGFIYFSLNKFKLLGT